MMLPLRRALKIVLTARERRQAGGLLLLAILGAIAETLGIGAIFPFLNLLADPGLLRSNGTLRAIFEWSGARDTERFVLYAAGALLIVYLLKNALVALIYHLQARFVYKLEYRIGIDLLRRYLGAPYTARLEQNSAERMHMINAEVPRVTTGFLLPVLALLTESCIVFGIVVLLFAWQPVPAAVALLIVGTTGLAFYKALDRSVTSLRKVRVLAQKQMYRWVQQSLGAIKETKVLGREEYFAGRFGASSEDYTQATRQFTFLNLLPRLGVESVAIAALMVTVVVVILRGHPLTEMIAVLILFGLAAARIMPSVTRILSALNTARFYMPAVEAIAREFEQSPAESDSVAPREGTTSRAPFERMSLIGVGYRYPASPQWALEGIDLDLRQGEFVAIVGRSGSGKTTLGDLLLGLLTPERGEIRINGKATESLRGEWRGVAGLVPQQFFLLDDTVRRNVAFGLPDNVIDENRVWRALQLAQLDGRIRNLPGGLDSQIGEQGGSLSGGERQRLSLARALYDDPDILVLDEATSALDPETEREIVETLRSLAGRKTLIVITHRATTANASDRTIFMRDGRLITQGSLAEVGAREPEIAQLLKDSN